MHCVDKHPQINKCKACRSGINMTKQEVFDRFYDELSQEEKENGPDGLPDFVVHIRKTQPKLPQSFMEWATNTTKKAE